MTVSYRAGDVFGAWVWHLPNKKHVKLVQLLSGKTGKIAAEFHVITELAKEERKESWSVGSVGRSRRDTSSFDTWIRYFTRRIGFKPTCIGIYRVVSKRRGTFQPVVQRGCVWMARVDRPTLRIRGKFKKTLPNPEALEQCPLVRQRGAK